jgi:hypothetical protein
MLIASLLHDYMRLRYSQSHTENGLEVDMTVASVLVQVSYRCEVDLNAIAQSSSDAAALVALLLRRRPGANPSADIRALTLTTMKANPKPISYI